MSFRDLTSTLARLIAFFPLHIMPDGCCDCLSQKPRGYSERVSSVYGDSMQAPTQSKIDRDDIKAVHTWRTRSFEKQRDQLKNPPPPPPLPPDESSQVELSNGHVMSGEAMRAWQQQGMNQDGPRNRNMATLDSIEIDDLSQNPLRLPESPPVSVASRPGPDSGESQPSKQPESLLKPSMSEEKSTIEGVESDELDAIVMAVEERQRTRTPSPVPGNRVWSPAVVPTMSFEDPILSRTSSNKGKPPVSPIPPSPKRRTLRSPSPAGEHSSPLRSLREAKNMLDASNYTEESKQESLLDVPSDVDPAVRDRYFAACHILKSSLMDKETVLSVQERSFLHSLVEEEDPSEARANELEAASEVLHSDPLFARTGNTQFALHSIEAASSNEDDILRTSEAPYAQLNGQDYPFRILGVDERAPPSVLTPMLMEAMRGFIPVSLSEEHFWLKFNLQRDGYDLCAMLSKVRTSRQTILAVETRDGYVFGAFCSSPWRIQRSWYGSGESFLWRLKNSRRESPNVPRSYSQDNEMEVYPFTGHDSCVQLVTSNALAVGGGDYDVVSETSPYADEPMGIGFTIDGDLGGGETSSCATFANPRLCGLPSSKETEFEIESVEVWTLTPCQTVVEAERMEMRRHFVEENVVTC